MKTTVGLLLALAGCSMPSAGADGGAGGGFSSGGGGGATGGGAGGSGGGAGGGPGWHLVASPPSALYGVFAVSDADVFAVGDGGAVWHDDGGVWSPFTSPAVGVTLRSVTGTRGNTQFVFAVGESNEIYRLHQLAWAGTGTSGDRFTSVSAGTPTTAVAVGSNSLGGVSYKWSGTTWTYVQPPTVYTAAFGMTFGAAAVGPGGAYGDLDLINGWAASGSGTARDLNAVWVDPTGIRWYVGAQGTIVSTIAGFTTYDSGTSVDLAALWGAAPDDLWAVGGAGTILHFDGGVWSQVPSPVAAELKAVHGSGPNDVWAVGTTAQGGVILHWP